MTRGNGLRRPAIVGEHVHSDESESDACDCLRIQNLQSPAYSMSHHAI